MSINYLLSQVGYKVTIWNVADDEENVTGVPSGEIVEWNVINRNFMQNDYPTATKLMPDTTMAMSDVLRKIVDNEEVELMDSVMRSFVSTYVTFIPTSTNDYICISYGSGVGTIYARNIQFISKKFHVNSLKSFVYKYIDKYI